MDLNALCFPLQNSRKKLNQTLRIMKLTAILLMIACLQVSATGFSQMITLAEKNAPLVKVLDKIEQQSGYTFAYTGSMLRKAKKISVNIQNGSLEQALKLCFTDQPFTFAIIEKTIVIKPVAEVESLPVPVPAEPAPPIEVSGVVTDETGKFLAGATVKLKGSDKGTSTNEQGSFSIQLPENGGRLVISYVGYETIEMPVTKSGSLKIVIKLADLKMEEVVVVAYGTQKKVNVTGAVGSVTAKDFADRPVTSVANALQGKMAGVTITTNNGQPGRDGGTIRVRGIGTGLGSSGASAAPLVIIDGVPGSMGDVNPNDIESISVLKDVASSAIYGARASNGVILITTKKGRKGGLQMRYEMYVGTQQITRRPDFLPAWQQAELYNEARANEGASLKWTPTDIQLFKDGTDKTGAHPNTDWLSLLYSEPGLQQNHNISINGGDEKTKYMFSLGYFDQNGNVKKSKYQKYNGLFNLSSQLNKKLGMNARLGFLYAPFSEPVSTYATSFSQLIRQINRISNTVPYKWENGAYGYVSDGSPMAWLESSSSNKWQNYTVSGNVGADWSPLQGFHIKPTFGYRLAIGQQQQYVSDIQYYKGGAAGVTLTPTKYEGPNNLTNATDRTTYTLLQVLADYEKSIGKHGFKILGGASQEYSAYNYFSAYRQNFLNNALTQINAAPASGQSASGYATDWALQSVFGRLNYNFDEKYLFEANLRSDGSSRFASANRWGIFPSASAGWVVSKENFFDKLSNTINVLKLRGSWGRLGNQQIANNYAYFETIRGGQAYSFNQTLVTGVAPDAGANPDLKWEMTESIGVGIDAAFLRNRLNVSIDYFKRKTENPLQRAVVGAPYAITSPYVNVEGAIENVGVELTVGYNDAIGKLNYNVNGNFSYIKNTVTKLTGGKVINPFGSGTFYDVGMPFNSLYGYEAEGIYQKASDVTGTAVINSKVSAGDIKYKDQNKDGKIDANDRVYLGTFYPKVTYGLTLGANWKGFELSLFLQGAAAVKAQVGNLIGGLGPDVQKPTSVFLNRWTASNPTANFPRASYSYKQNDGGSNPSSFWVKDASYLRLKNLLVAYNLPKSVVNKIGLNNVKVFYSGQNILTITKFYKWIDPEIGNAGSIYAYPQVKVNTFGLNVTF
jgi:TonB-linked SusC/RagA family outer membrane protein